MGEEWRVRWREGLVSRGVRWERSGGLVKGRVRWGRVRKGRVIGVEV